MRAISRPARSTSQRRKPPSRIPAPAAAARESARRSDGKFGAQARHESQLELFPAPGDRLRPSLAKALSAFSEQVSEGSWEFLPGEQLKAAFPSPDVTGFWNTRSGSTGSTGSRLGLSCAEGTELHHYTFAAPTAAAAASDMTAALDRLAGYLVPYRRDDLITDEVAVEVAFGVSPMAYSQRLGSRHQRDLAAGAYHSAPQPPHSQDTA